MAIDPKPLTRNQIAAFVGNDPEAVRAIERLFRVAGELTPSDIATLSEAIEANTLALGAAQGLAETLSQFARISDTVQGLALAPPVMPARRRTYGTFYDINTQTAAAINTAYPVTFSNTDLSFGVYLVSGSRITVNQNGVYDFQHSFQVDKTTGGKGIFWLWYAKNGVDVAESATKVAISGGGSETVAAWNYVFKLKAGDYIEYKWAVDDVNVTITRFPAAAPVPGIPSAIVTVTDNIGE